MFALEIFPGSAVAPRLPNQALKSSDCEATAGDGLGVLLEEWLLIIISEAFMLDGIVFVFRLCSEEVEVVTGDWEQLLITAQKHPKNNMYFFMILAFH